jgi:hypothetical protein
MNKSMIWVLAAVAVLLVAFLLLRGEAAPVDEVLVPEETTEIVVEQEIVVEEEVAVDATTTEEVVPETTE